MKDESAVNVESLERAWELLEAGDHAGARRIADELAATAAAEPEVLLLQAGCAREEGDVEQALSFLERAAAADPEWATPEIWAAELLASEPDRLPEALVHATSALDRADEEDEYVESILVKAGIEVDLGKRDAARQTLSELPAPDEVAIEPAWALEAAHLLLAVDEFAAAQERFLAMTKGDPKLADAWYGVGLAAEAQDDEQESRKAWLRTLELDEKEPLESPLLAEAEMVAVAEKALAELPPAAHKLIQNVPIIVADLPARDDVAKGLDPRLLGLFAGIPHPDDSTLGPGSQVTQIILFRKNLERMANDEDELREEIRTTLLHETGHFFGMSEEDLEAVGLD